jgi:hypothetical protein
VLLTSRAFSEYHAMFDLRPDDLAGRTVVDVAAGASDFTAVAPAHGARAFAIDPGYAAAPAELARGVAHGATAGLSIVDEHPQRFTWDWYGDRAHRDELRLNAAEVFAGDRDEHPQRYLAGSLPRLPLRDKVADLALCSHLLFTWSDQLDRDWHRAAIIELNRIARRARIFPLVVQGTGEPVGWLPELIADLADIGIRAQRRRVPYEFQVGGYEMIEIVDS